MMFFLEKTQKDYPKFDMLPISGNIDLTQNLLFNFVISLCFKKNKQKSKV